MTGFFEICSQLKARQFKKAVRLLQNCEEEIDGRIVFKLLRSLASQLKLKGLSEGEDSVDKFLQECCTILKRSKDLASDDTEFTQGVLSLYHLVSHVINTGDCSDTIILLSETLLSCLQKFAKSSKDVESIAANSFAHVWNAANKVDSGVSQSYRTLALCLLVNGGVNHWNRLVDKLISVNQEPSPSALELSEAVFEQLVLYCSHRDGQDIAAASYLLQLWVVILFSSAASAQHKKSTSHLRCMAKKSQEPGQITWLMNLAESLFGYADKPFEVPVKRAKLTKELEVALIRIVFLVQSQYSVILNQSEGSTKPNRKHQMASIIWLLLFFADEVDRLASGHEANWLTDAPTQKIRCLSRAGSIACQLLKLDSSRVDLCHAVCNQSDELLKQGLNQKAAVTFLTAIEITTYNTGVILHHEADYSTAVCFFRKSFQYVVQLQQLQSADVHEVSSNFSGRFNALYDCRVELGDWTGVASDFALALGACYGRSDAGTKFTCRSRPILQYLLTVWLRFKRELNHSAPAEEHVLRTTLADVCNQNQLVLGTTSAWELLHEEYQVFDRRKGSIPKVAVSAVVQQAAGLARTAFQKGISSFFLARDETDPTARLAAAKRAVAKLTSLDVASDPQAQYYLALSYLELYVGQQELLKNKTEEEMVLLGPLIQSSSNVDVPPGEDGANIASDGTSVDAISYSYLKLELELKSQEWMVKSLEQWEELILLSNWRLEQYSTATFDCLKSLGYYFGLAGNSFYGSRAWSLLLRLALSANCDEEVLLASSELLRLGKALDPEVIGRCQELVDKKGLMPQEMIHFHLSLAWSKYYKHQFVECSDILHHRVLQSATLSSETPSKSVMVLLSQANMLRSLLIVMPEELSGLPPPDDCGPVQAALKAAQTAYAALKFYVSHAKIQGHWDFYGQEWYVLRLFLVSAVNLARIYLFIASPREARFFLKEALSAAQKHVSVLRTAEALLELCTIDLMLDNTIDCQSKLVLICHSMGMAPPVIPDNPAGSKAKPPNSPTSPVQEIVSRRSKGYKSTKVPEAPIELQQDANHRYLQLPFNHQGTSPATKARELSDRGVFPDHTTECACVTCSNELVASIRLQSLNVQAKLWSILGFQELALEEFDSGGRLMESVCSRIRSLPKPVAKQPTKRLFDVLDTSRASEEWQEHKIEWFQPPLLTGLELMMERSMHLLCMENRNAEAEEGLKRIRNIMYDLYVGPMEHRAMKLTVELTIGSLQQSPIHPPVARMADLDVGTDDDEVVVLQDGNTPKTPALGLRKPLEMPPPRRIRRNILNVNIEDTITIEDDEDSDSAFSRRRYGDESKKAIQYSSDSGDDLVLPQLPPVDLSKKKQPTTKSVGKVEAAKCTATKRPVGEKTENRFFKAKPATDRPLPSDDSPALSNGTAAPAAKTVRRRVVKLSTAESEESDNDESPKTQKPGKRVTKAKAAPKSAEIGPTSVSEKRFFKTKGSPAVASTPEDLNGRFAAIKIDSEESRPKRSTRSTKK